MPSIFSADWRNELNFELAGKQPLLDSGSIIAIAQASIGSGVYRSYNGTPISALVPGSTFGALIEGAAAGHLVLGIRDNDPADSVSIVSYNGTGAYSRRVAAFKADGLIQIFGQLQFPATQQASADPNTLDDYEEGTWTPGITFGGAATGITYTSQVGVYTKIGRFVHMQWDLVLSNKGTATGLANITGTPFSIASQASGSIGFYQNMAMPAGTTMYLNAAATTIAPRYADNALAAQLSNAHFTNTSRIIGSLSFAV